MNSYDQEATTAEFGKLGVNLFFLFFFFSSCMFFCLMVLGPHTLFKTLYWRLELYCSILNILCSAIKERKEPTEGLLFPIAKEAISMPFSLKELWNFETCHNKEKNTMVQEHKYYDRVFSQSFLIHIPPGSGKEDKGLVQPVVWR